MKTIGLMLAVLLLVAAAPRAGANHAADGVPIHTEEVAFTGATEQIQLAGSLTRPANLPRDRRLPAAVLIHGSGPNDRDETLYGHKPFLTLAQLLTGAGYAVLRYDKRGVGQSNGTPSGATLRDYAEDAEAAFDYLRKRPDIDASRIGLVGHSEGGMIAPMIGSRRSDVAWLILLAPPAVPGRELVMYQNAQSTLDHGGTEERAKLAAETARRLFDIVALDLPEAERDLRLVAELRKVRAERGLPEQFIDDQRRTLMSHWFRDILVYDPAPMLESLRQPVLALYAERDHQVPPSLNEAPARAALKNNPNAEVQVLPGLNHLFLPAQSGSVTEYLFIKGDIHGSALDTLKTWLKTDSEPRRPT